MSSATSFNLPPTDTPPDNTYFDNRLISWDFIVDGQRATLGHIQPGFNEIFPVAEGGEQITLLDPKEGAELSITELGGKLKNQVTGMYDLVEDGETAIIPDGKNMQIRTAGKAVQYVCIYRGQLEESVFGGRDFTLTTADVAEVREERARDVAEREAILADSGEDDRVKRSVEKGMDRSKAEAKFFSAVNDEDILEIARAIFKRGQALEEAGATKEKVVSTIYEEIPQAEFMYQLLRKNPWGYRLGTAKTAIDANRRSSQVTTEQ